MATAVKLAAQMKYTLAIPVHRQSKAKEKGKEKAKETPKEQAQARAKQARTATKQRNKAEQENKVSITETLLLDQELYA